MIWTILAVTYGVCVLWAIVSWARDPSRRPGDTPNYWQAMHRRRR